MSKIKIVGHASGTGVLTIAAPNTNTDRTITIPDVTGTLLDSGSDLPAANLTGTIASARIADDAITTAKLANSINTEIAANTAKTGITSSQATAITAALPKAGGTMTGALTLSAGDVGIANNQAFRSDSQALLARYDPIIEIGSGDSGDYLKFKAGAAERLRIATAGQIGIGGANYGSDGQVLTSTGASSAPAWENVVSSFSGLTDTTISASDPAVNSNPSAVGHLWVQSTSGEAYICTDATTNQNDWTNIGAGTGDVKYFVPVTSLMLIGGGGGGAGDLRGGAGAGGLLFFTGFQGTLAYSTSYTITIGSGGTAPNAGANGGDGNNSTAFGETAGGGGGGGTGSANANAGGDSGSVNIATSSSNYTTGNGYGNVGGSNGGNPGAGGGGAGAAAANMASGNRAGGDGGAGKQFANIYNGSDNYYWAGGGGGPGYGNAEDGGDGGIGGGGGGGVYSEGNSTGTLSTGGGSALDNGDAGGNQNNSNNGGDGGTNTGAGAGSGSHRGGGQTSSTGGPGGSGIVCIKMPDSTTDATTSGTVVKTTTGGYKYYAFTSSGTITFNP